MKRLLLLPATLVLLFAGFANAEDGSSRRGFRVFEATRLQPEVEETYEPAESAEPAAPAPLMYEDFPGYYPGYSSYRGLGFQGYCCEAQSPCTSRLWAGFCAARHCAYDYWPLQGGLLSGWGCHRFGCGSCSAKGTCDSGCSTCAVQKGGCAQKGPAVQKTWVSQKGFAPRQPVVSQKMHVPQKGYVTQKSFVPQKSHVTQKSFVPQRTIVSQKAWATQKTDSVQKSPVVQKSAECCPPAIRGGWWPTLPLCARKHLLKGDDCDTCGTVKGKGGVISEPYYNYSEPVEAESEQDEAEILPPPPFEDRPTEFRSLPAPSSQDRSAQLLDWLRNSPPAQSF